MLNSRHIRRSKWRSIVGVTTLSTKGDTNYPNNLQGYYENKHLISWKKTKQKERILANITETSVVWLITWGRRSCRQLPTSIDATLMVIITTTNMITSTTTSDETLWCHTNSKTNKNKDPEGRLKLSTQPKKQSKSSNTKNQFSKTMSKSYLPEHQSSVSAIT